VREVAFQSMARARVALRYFAQLVVHAFAAPCLQHADLRQAVVGGEQGVAGEGAEVRIDAHRRGRRSVPPGKPQRRKMRSPLWPKRASPRAIGRAW
jgi:hypothetical protein